MIKAITANDSVAVEMCSGINEETLLEFIAIAKVIVDETVKKNGGKEERDAILAAVNKIMSEAEEEENGQQNSNDQS